ncbi:MAG: hypothetical protein A2Z99_08860 [Treponema sp. GWB1_62_6]|nr:MAG: hypothetical protein A2001_15925 [Treponema sp. GWC1_61_84]OHE69766.1 MAG: hypothetical protein A2Z99_08860 [Treponema sp. GWB1_62_6]OHE73666.1 MAG: hypothetical protein A2413_10515 [Treponema sp. RIFOXYC1_FULL_61_9]
MGRVLQIRVLPPKRFRKLDGEKVLNLAGEMFPNGTIDYTKNSFFRHFRSKSQFEDGFGDRARGDPLR